MKSTRGYKTELDPTVKQHILLCQCAGTARFAYNYGLARKQEVYKESGKTISAIDLQKELTKRKHSEMSTNLTTAPCGGSPAEFATRTEVLGQVICILK